MNANPSPSSTDATSARSSSGRSAPLRPQPRCTTYAAATAQNTTGRSQLWYAYSTSGGPTAHSSARQRASLPSSQPVASPNGAISSAENSRNSASLCAKIAPPQISRPVSTGYSTTPPTRTPLGVMLPCT